MNLQEFIAANGGRGSEVAIGPITFILPTGAQYSGSPGSELYTLIDPPAEPTARLHAQLRYCKAKLVAEEKAFNDFRRECDTMDRHHANNPQSCAPAPFDAAEQLRVGQKRIKKLRQQIAELEDRIGETKADQDRRRIADMEAEQRARVLERQAERNAIQI
jgi:hypothetical protein